MSNTTATFSRMLGSSQFPSLETGPYLFAVLARIMEIAMEQLGGFAASCLVPPHRMSLEGQEGERL